MTVEDYREIARRRLPSFLFHYLDGAAGRELTANRNCAALDAVLLRQAVMVDVGDLKVDTELFGAPMAMPIVLGPVGLAGLLARRGENQAYQAASGAGIPFCASTLSVCAIDEVARAARDAPSPWFQLYIMRDRAFMIDLLHSARAAGASVLVLTVDVPVSGIRPRDERHGLTGSMRTLAWQAALRPGWLLDVALRGRPLLFGNLARAQPDARSLADFWQWLSANFDPTVTWQDIELVRQHWNGPIVIKGIMTPDDARAAAAAGADGVVVSNHGGRQLDGVQSTIEALGPIVDAIGNDMPVLVDGGIRSGVDVVKALANGAQACLLGRAWAFALAAGGQKALERYLGGLQKEIVNTLALTGSTDIRKINSNILIS